MVASDLADNPGWWCADNAAICRDLWWCSPTNYVLTTTVGMAFWTLMFIAIIRIVFPKVEKWLATWPSKIEDENCAAWFAWHVQSTIHASTVVAMALPAVRRLTYAPASAQFAQPAHEHMDHMPDITMIAKGSHVFFCYILVDTFVALYREAMTPDYLAHHAVFVFFCLLIQYDCFAPYLAGFLLLMETSTIFLNCFSFTRNRLGYDHWVVKVCFLLFASTFIVFRLVGTTYIAYLFSRTVLLDGKVPFTGIARWHLNILCIALAAAVSIQLFWGCAIGSKLIRILTGKGGSSGRGDKKGTRPEASPAETNGAGGAFGGEHRLKSG
mmetsp:Transcript_1490/g.3806  ORF Transcript_1490/g.3806 Transcript_1490/m.3806 type:complete len:326 (-) Transcript_1490:132-1109(-)